MPLEQVASGSEPGIDDCPAAAVDSTGTGPLAARGSFAPPAGLGPLAELDAEEADVGEQEGDDADESDVSGDEWDALAFVPADALAFVSTRMAGDVDAPGVSGPAAEGGVAPTRASGSPRAAAVAATPSADAKRRELEDLQAQGGEGGAERLDAQAPARQGATEVPTREVVHRTGGSGARGSRRGGPIGGHLDRRANRARMTEARSKANSERDRRERAGGGRSSNHLNTSHHLSKTDKRASASQDRAHPRANPKMLTKKMVMQELLLEMHKKWRTMKFVPDLVKKPSKGGHAKKDMHEGGAAASTPGATVSDLPCYARREGG